MEKNFVLRDGVSELYKVTYGVSGFMRSKVFSSKDKALAFAEEQKQPCYGNARVILTSLELIK